MVSIRYSCIRYKKQVYQPSSDVVHDISCHPVPFLHILGVSAFITLPRSSSYSRVHLETGKLPIRIIIHASRLIGNIILARARTSALSIETFSSSGPLSTNVDISYNGLIPEMRTDIAVRVGEVGQRLAPCAWIG